MLLIFVWIILFIIYETTSITYTYTLNFTSNCSCTHDLQVALIGDYGEHTEWQSISLNSPSNVHVNIFLLTYTIPVNGTVIGLRISTNSSDDICINPSTVTVSYS